MTCEMKDKYVRDYDLCGQTLRVVCDNAQWLEKVEAFLPLPKAAALGEPDWQIVYHCMDMKDVDRLLPLPAEEYRTYMMQFDDPITLSYSVYCLSNVYWYEWSGVGRIKADPDSKCAEVVILTDHTVPEIFQYILLIERGVGRLVWRDFHAIHAGCVRVGNKGILLTGPSGAGKSTATYALMSHGSPALSDDIVYVKKQDGYLGMTLTGVIKLRREAECRFFPNVRLAANGIDVADETYFPLKSLHQGNFAQTIPLQAVIAVEQSGRPESCLHRVSPLKVVSSIFPVTLLEINADRMARKFDFITDMLNGLDCYRLEFGTDMRQFASMMEEWGFR